MDMNQLTIGEFQKLAAILGDSAEKKCPFEPGQCYLIRTVTMFWLGRVTQVVGDFLVLEHASWIADTGRFHEAVDVEHLVEVEPVASGRKVFVGLGTIVDAQNWDSNLPTKAK